MALQYLQIIFKFCIFCKFCNVSLLEIQNSFVIKSIFLSLFLLSNSQMYALNIMKYLSVLTMSRLQGK